MNTLEILKSYNRKDIHICLSSDSNYEPHLWVTIYTILQNAKSNKKYNIYILDGGIKHKEYFYKLIESNKRFHIQFLDMSNQYISVYESRHVSKAAYYRLSILDIFKDFDKVMYLDADSYVLGDINELFDMNIKDKQIAGVKDSITYEIPWREKKISYKNYSGKALDYFNEYLHLSDSKLNNYFSSGVLVFNLKKIDKEKKIKKLKELLKNDYYCHDQDILNLLFDENETFLLGREWNYFNSGPVLKPYEFLNDEERNNYLNGKVSPKVVSYVLKPWLKENLDKPYVKEYWDILSLSPYYNDVKREMESNTKWNRFKKKSLKEKIKYLTSIDAIEKYKSALKKLYRNKK